MRSPGAISRGLRVDGLKDVPVAVSSVLAEPSSAEDEGSAGEAETVG